VHALAQTAHIDVPASRFQEPARWLAAINSDLPAEVRIVRARWAPASFHARFSATGKIYRYRVWNSRILPPLEIGRVWPIYDPIDLERLHECARLLTGRHDFGGFAANRGTPEEDTTRTIRRIGIRGKPGGLIELQFEGDGFLYRMVRLMTGSMVRCARGKADPAWLAGLLEPPMPSAMDQPRRKTSFAAPAEGLYLVRVLYGAKPRSQRAASV
jgi:tRNA pseudouridine38-40 synthase